MGNFQALIQNALPGLRTGQRAVQFGLQITTWLVVGSMVWSYMGPLASFYLSFPVTVVLTFIFSYGIDGMLAKVLPIATTTKGMEDAPRKVLLSFRAIFFVLTFITGTISWWAMPEIANRLTPQADTKKEQNTILRLNGTREKLLADQAATIKRAEQHVMEQEQAARMLVTQALNSNPKAAKLRAQGNDWVETDKGLAPWRKRVRDAEKRAAENIAQAQKKLQEAEDRKAEIVANFTKEADATNSDLLGIIKAKEKAAADRLKNNTTALVLIDITWMLVLVVLSFLIGAVGGHEPIKRKDAVEVMFVVGDSISDKFLSSVERFFRQLNQPKKTTPPDVLPIAANGRELSAAQQTILELKRKLSEMPTEKLSAPEPLSDNDPGRQPAQPRTVLQTEYVDLSVLADNTRKQWERAHTSKKELTRQINRQKAQEGIEALRSLGAEVIINGAKLEISLP